MMKSLKTLLLCLGLIAPFALLAQGQCTDEDLEFIGNNFALLQQITADCGVDCLFEADPEACFDDCMSPLVPLTGPCVGCFSAQTSCGTENCLIECVFGATEACETCIAENCLPAFNECAGIVDEDNDTFTTLNDCDDTDNTIFPGATEIWYDGIDQNCDGLNDFDQDQDGDPSYEFGGTDCNDNDPNTNFDAVTYYADLDMDGFGDPMNATVQCALPPGFTTDNTDCDDSDELVYPGAPGNNTGADNNCDGVIGPDEVFICVGDLDDDFTVGTNDLLIFLTAFSCTEDCIVDLDGEDGVGSSDLLIFLSAFGLICQ